MKVKKYTDSKIDSNIKTAILFENNGKDLYIFSDYDEDLTYAIVKCFIDGKYEKVTEEA